MWGDEDRRRKEEKRRKEKKTEKDADKAYSDYGVARDAEK
jgi:hypothetical protein